MCCGYCGIEARVSQLKIYSISNYARHMWHITYLLFRLRSEMSDAIREFLDSLGEELNNE